MPPEEVENTEVEAVSEELPEALPEGPEMAYVWDASEYAHNHKSPMWYVTLLGILAVLIAILVWLQLWLEIPVFIAAAVAIIVYASKPPRTLHYELSSEGVHIEGKLYPFSYFRSFSVFQEPEWHSIDLDPAKRFNPRLSLLFDTDDYDQIVGHLERHLPREDRELDMIERFTRYVRF